LLDRGVRSRIVLVLLALTLGIALVSDVHAQHEPAKAGSGQRMYRYKTAAGRAVYTNLDEQVPLEQRSNARIDLDRVSLNTEVGNAIARRVQAEHASLIQTSYCAQLRTAAEEGFVTRLWRDFAPLVIAALVLLLLLAISPIALRRFGAPAWSKTLCFAIPTVFAVGLLVFSMSKTQRSIEAFKTRAKPCSEQSLANLSAKPDAAAEHARLVADLKREIANSGVGNLTEDMR
jgi:hypothetical protein